MLKIGIVGLPNVGKSTLFQALTKKQVDTSNYPFATIDPNVGVVPVPDKRLEKLAELSHSKKVVPAVIEFVDIAGLVKGAATGEGLGNKFLAHIREADAICEVVRAFEDTAVHHVSGRVHPEDDIATIHTELMCADLGTVERAVPKIDKEARSGNKRSQKKLALLRELERALANGSPPSFPPITTPEEDEMVTELQLLTAKPVIYVWNIKETEPKESLRHTLSLNIKLEDEIAALGDRAGDVKELSRIDQLIEKAYEILELITFFTTGEDETRAWSIPKGSHAPRAGRAIHSDFEEKFIRAEVIPYEDLMHAGSFAKARREGLVAIKGKDYIVEDGDIVEFKI